MEGNTTIRFRGPPGALEAAVALPRAPRAFIRIRGERIPLRTFGDAKQITVLAFSMPDDTAPGESAAEVVYGGDSRKAVVEVLARSRVRVTPGTVTLQRTADGALVAQVQIGNSGNADVALQAEQVVTLRPPGALGRGIRHAFGEPGRDLPERLIELGRNLAEEAALEIAVTVSSEALILTPGEQVRVSVAAAAPSDLKPGSAWTGRLTLYGVQIPVTLDQES